MTFEEFHNLALDYYDEGGDIIYTEYTEEDFNEWINELECDPTTANYLMEFGNLCKFYKECEDITNVRPKGEK